MIDAELITRNRIAHEYNALDHSLVHEGLQVAASDIPQYLGRVRNYLDMQEPR